MGGFRSPLLPFGFSGGVVVPIRPLPTTAVAKRELVSQLNIRSQISRIQGFNTDISQSLSAVQDNSNSIDERLRRLTGSLNSLGLTKDAAGNVAIQGSTFTISLPLQNFAMVNQSVIQSLPPAPLAQPLPVSSMSFYVDEVGNNLIVQVTYSDGTTKTATLPLV